MRSIGRPHLFIIHLSDGFRLACTSARRLCVCTQRVSQRMFFVKCFSQFYWNAHLWYTCFGWKIHECQRKCPVPMANPVVGSMSRCTDSDCCYQKPLRTAAAMCLDVAASIAGSAVVTSFVVVVVVDNDSIRIFFHSPLSVSSVGGFSHWHCLVCVCCLCVGFVSV